MCGGIQPISMISKTHFGCSLFNSALSRTWQIDRKFSDFHNLMDEWNNASAVEYLDKCCLPKLYGKSLTHRLSADLTPLSKWLWQISWSLNLRRTSQASLFYWRFCQQQGKFDPTCLWVGPDMNFVGVQNSIDELNRIFRSWCSVFLFPNFLVNLILWLDNLSFLFVVGQSHTSNDA